MGNGQYQYMGINQWCNNTIWADHTNTMALVALLSWQESCIKSSHLLMLSVQSPIVLSNPNPIIESNHPIKSSNHIIIKSNHWPIQIKHISTWWLRTWVNAHWTFWHLHLESNQIELIWITSLHRMKPSSLHPDQILPTLAHYVKEAAGNYRLHSVDILPPQTRIIFKIEYIYDIHIMIIN